MRKTKKSLAGDCKTCSNATLFRHGTNPVIAECVIDGERWVASAGKPVCSFYRKSASELKIELKDLNYEN